MVYAQLYNFSLVKFRHKSNYWKIRVLLTLSKYKTKHANYVILAPLGRYKKVKLY